MVTKSGSGTGTVSSFPGRIDCGIDCLENYDAGAVTLNASQTLVFFSAAGQVGDAQGRGYAEVTMNSDVTVTADFTDANTFTKVTMVSPNGREKLPSGESWNLIWGGPPEVTSYKLSYSLDNGTTWKSIIADAGSGTSWIWTLPTVKKNTKTCLTRVVGYNGTTKVGADKSDRPFTIEVVSLNYPNGADASLSSGQNATILWTTHHPRAL
jgi:hypothetical protein